MPLDYESWRVATTGGFLRRVDEMLEDPLAPPQIAALTSSSTIHRSSDVHDDVATVNGQVLAWDTSIGQYKVRTVKDIYESQTDGQIGFSTDASGIVLRSGKRIKFNDADSSAGLSLQAASEMATNVTLTLPSVAPTSHQVLRANLTTPTTLEWADGNRRSTREFLITSYGAVCDGVTDDAPAINAALAACGNDGVITFPPCKNIKINDTILVSNGGIWMEGNGCRLIKDRQMDMIYVSGSYNVIRDFVLDGGNSNWTGIFLVGSFNRALNNRIYNCGSYGNPGHGIGIGKNDGTCTRNIVMGNHISHCGDIGISQNQAKESIIVDNMVETCGAEGITIDVASDRGLVAHNVIKGCCVAGGVGGIGIDQVTMVSVIGNLIQDTGGSLPGIKFQNNIGSTTFVTITGNRLIGNAGGIYLSKNVISPAYRTHECYVGGNMIYSTLGSSYGIKIDADCAYNKVSGNQIGVVGTKVIDNGLDTTLDFDSPITTAGDIIYGGTDGIPTRLGVVAGTPGSRALITNSAGTAVEWSGMGFNGTNQIATCLAMLGGNVTNGNYKIVIGPSTHNSNVNNVTLISPTAITTSGGAVSAFGIVGIGCASLIGDHNVVVGYASSAGNHSSTVVGTFCSANTYFGIALGHWSSAGEHGIAIGATDTGNTTAQTGQTLAGTLSIAIGKTAKAGTRGIAIGPNATATFNATGIDGSVAIGYNAKTTTETSIANQSVVIGCGARVENNTTAGTAVGCGSTTGSQSVCIGQGSNAYIYSSAIGSTADAGDNSVAIGFHAFAKLSSVAIGYEVDRGLGENYYSPNCNRAVLIGNGVTCRPFDGQQILEPVIIGSQSCRGRNVGQGVCVIGGTAARSNETGADSFHFIRDSTIIGHDVLKDYVGNLDGVLRIGAHGRELVGGTMPTSSYNYTTGGAQSNTGTGIFDIFGRIRLHTNNRQHILEGEFVGKTNPLTQPCIRWRTYDANTPDTVAFTYDLNLH